MHSGVWNLSSTIDLTLQHSSVFILNDKMAHISLLIGVSLSHLKAGIHTLYTVLVLWQFCFWKTVVTIGWWILWLKIWCLVSYQPCFLQCLLSQCCSIHSFFSRPFLQTELCLSVLHLLLFHCLQPQYCVLWWITCAE